MLTDAYMQGETYSLKLHKDDIINLSGFRIYQLPCADKVDVRIIVESVSTGVDGRNNPRRPLLPEVARA